MGQGSAARRVTGLDPRDTVDGLKRSRHAEPLLKPQHRQARAQAGLWVPRWCLALVLLEVAVSVRANDVHWPADRPAIRGHLAAHDPSTVVWCGDRHYVFSTGRGIQSKSSRGLVYWESGPTVFAVPPAWTTAAVPGFDGTFWAPDVILLNGKYHVYYSVSTWGSQVSAIGLATNPTLDARDPAYVWTDHGPVIQSGNGSPYNAIDPSVLQDSSGRLWMAFGSYWKGIYVVELDPATGLPTSSDPTAYRVAYNDSIEAACLYQRAGYSYLFVNWGSCCSGVNSTYHIRVGRSRTPTGPFVDRRGIDLVDRGGTLFLEGTGKHAGPGHVGILSQAGQDWFSYHYYDANAWAAHYGAYGPARLALARLSWSADGWPVCATDWSAVCPLESDARDENRQYHGLLQNGAAFAFDPQRGSVLDLAGTGQHVGFPPGVGYARTFAAVVKWRGGAAWQPILDFGAGAARTLRLTPASDRNTLCCEIDAGNGVQRLEWTRALPKHEWAHVAVTFDSARGTLYVNGAAVATNAAIKVSPVDVRPQTNYLGASRLTPGLSFNGQVALFQAHGRALTAEELRAPVIRLIEPLDGSSFEPGGRVRLAGSATDFMQVNLEASGLTWRVEHVAESKTNLVFGPVTGTANGSFVAPLNATQGVLRVTLTATDPAQRQAVATATLFHGPSWRAFYPFSDGGADASNRFPASLEGGATVQADPLLGGVLHLTGNGQYLSLPADAGAIQTVAALVKWDGGAPRQRVFDFGKSARASLYLTPRNASGQIQCSITPDQFSYVHTIESSIPFPVGQWTHVAVTLDGRQGVLYLNGKPVGVNNSVNLMPSDLDLVNCWLGRSQSSADPFFRGQLDSVVLSSAALWPEQTLVAPPLDAVVADQALRLSWPPWGAGFALWSVSEITQTAPWSPVVQEPEVADGFWTLSMPVAGPRRFYRLQWPWPTP